MITRDTFDNIPGKLEYLRLELLLCNNPDKAQALAARINELMAKQHRYRRYLEKRRAARIQRGREVLFDQSQGVGA